MQWCHHSSLQPQTPGLKQSSRLTLPKRRDSRHEPPRLACFFIFMPVSPFISPPFPVSLSLHLSLFSLLPPHLPALTVIASKNCSLHEWVPITKAKFVFLMSLSTVFWGREGWGEVTAPERTREAPSWVLGRGLTACAQGSSTFHTPVLKASKEKGGMCCPWS